MSLIVSSNLIGYFLIMFSVFSSCGSPKSEIMEHQQEASSHQSIEHILKDIVDTTVYYADTIIVQTTEDLLEKIESNRLILLENKTYYLQSTIQIDHLNNLKIVGTGLSKLVIPEKNTTVIKISNSYNIHLEGLTIGHTESTEHQGTNGILSISHSQYINVFNCKLLSAGNIGLFTSNTRHLKFYNSEITKATFLILQFDKSQKFHLKNATFYDNHLNVSVLAGFTDSTKEILFTDCLFLNNLPATEGNPAFNFMDNWENFDEPIIFTNCTFKGNKGYKWYGDKIKLNDCEVEKSDFIDFEEGN